VIPDVGEGLIPRHRRRLEGPRAVDQVEARVRDPDDIRCVVDSLLDAMIEVSHPGDHLVSVVYPGPPLAGGRAVRVRRITGDALIKLGRHRRAKARRTDMSYQSQLVMAQRAAMHRRHGRAVVSPASQNEIWHINRPYQRIAAVCEARSAFGGRQFRRSEGRTCHRVSGRGT
jgi:hypothetical protein